MSGITLQELSKHNTKKSCWIALHGTVFDVTWFLNEHPGGEELILDVAGKDATVAFDNIGHSESAIRTLTGLSIGYLETPK